MKKIMPNNKFAARLSAVVIACALLASCSTTRRIPKDEILYNGLKKVEFAQDSVKIPLALESTIKTAVDVPPNNYWKL
ncbi:MAG: hypothetical protein K2J10_03225, partial [Muribaculaceae bacterium]|nr:hypothetical protein [Muribaculaceae bacterium]